MGESGESNSLSSSGGEGKAESETTDSDVRMELGEVGRLLLDELDFVCFVAGRFEGEMSRGESFGADGGV